ncbi:SDR family oxidoreductase [Cohnella sp. CFH 77786]|uniref:elongation factor P 5-aminopentanone reductase n=1 Tax=Cohnella sp. CFH 77786 TaxID=2662265 RepID=UPI001C60AAC2|nr:3-oxoacyl-ACP reductase FabG [Cohnella sp. CFH 77786]MBW5444507.1 SDR family oxidoreductase [Cohnella sp. CFH 77786]
MNRRALVTGGSRGIGAAAARRLAAGGADVAIPYYASEEAAQRVAAQCRELGVRAEPIRADVRDGESLLALKDRLEALEMSPDILVHSAGTAFYGLLEDCGEDAWDEIMGVHLKAAYRLTRLFAPGMAWRRWGRIIYMSSIWGVIGASGEAAYAAAKGGLNAFAKSMAKELASSGVTVNAVAPGAIETDMLAGLTEEDRLAICRDIPLGRLGQPDEVADLIRFLTSDEAGYMTGQVLGINGGWSA